MNFMNLDITFLVLFLIGVSIFLYYKRKEIKREGLLFLYNTKWGIKLIEKTGKKYSGILEALSYVSVGMGYILMGLILYFFIRTLWIYAFHWEIVKAIKVPPIMPLIPYFPKIFKLSFLPPLFFSYWIIILAIIAISHEFFHGIFAAKSKVKIKQTGFGFFPFFFPIFTAAFVQLNEKTMEKKSNFEQRAILSAGTFANILTAILGVLLMAGFFMVAYAPVGVVYNDYAYNVVNIGNVSSMNGIPINMTGQNNISFSEIVSSNKINLTSKKDFTINGQKYYSLKEQVGNKLLLYFDTPAIRNNLSGVITDINGVKIKNLKILSSEIEKYPPGKLITLKIYDGKDIHNQDLILGKNPKTGKSWIGVAFIDKNSRTLLSKITSFITSYKNPHVFYIQKWAFSKFIYDFLWWLVLIAFSVAIINMLPMGIFDGGRFFYLTVLMITKSEKKAKKSFKFMTNFLLGLLALIMILWVRGLFKI